MSDLAHIIRGVLAGKRVAIIGDIVADQYLNGTISRISREAPVFILRHDETETRAGGAANAAVNVASLGGVPILVGAIGSDRNGEFLRASLMDSGVGDEFLVASPQLMTTTKLRVLAGRHYAPRQQVIRIDYEGEREIDAETRERLLSALTLACRAADAIVFSDYNYGAASPEMFKSALQIAANRSIPLVADSRFRLGDFAGATSATPNQEEVEQILGREFAPSDGDALRERLRLQALLVTCGNKGMVLAEAGRPALEIPAVGSEVPVDVTGAGDTVIAAYALGLAGGLTFLEAAKIANHAASIAVMKKGTASVTTEELVASLSPSPSLITSETAA